VSAVAVPCYTARSANAVTGLDGAAYHRVVGTPLCALAALDANFRPSERTRFSSVSLAAAKPSADEWRHAFVNRYVGGHLHRYGCRCLPMMNVLNGGGASPTSMCRHPGVHDFVPSVAR